ncbi:MAG: hypothetical protein IPL31_04960, partial [Saprospiraceae bacterium]|nr:hypothetical protein [Saprospiraceae bacterium]
MKYLTPIILTILIVISYWQIRNSEKLTTEVIDIRNSIDEYSKHKFDRWERAGYFSTIHNTLEEPDHPYTNKEILEMHWITLILGWEVKFIKIESKMDSSINLTYKFATLKNLNDKSGIDSLRQESTQKIDKTVWLKFKEKMNNINIYDLTYWDGGGCIGNSLKWEAAINNRDYKYETNCGNALLFTEACEFMMRQVNDPGIQEMLDYKEAVQERL